MKELFEGMQESTNESHLRQDFLFILKGDNLSTKERKIYTKICQDTETVTEFWKQIYKAFYKKDISHITDKYEKHFHKGKMLQEIAEYHFSK